MLDFAFFQPDGPGHTAGGCVLDRDSLNGVTDIYGLNSTDLVQQNKSIFSQR